MNNTIMITGTVKITQPNYVRYDVIIWGSQVGEQIQYITSITLDCNDYNDLWKAAKEIVSVYKQNNKFYDGAYTAYLDHLIRIN